MDDYRLRSGRKLGLCSAVCFFVFFFFSEASLPCVHCAYIKQVSRSWLGKETMFAQRRADLQCWKKKRKIIEQYLRIPDTAIKRNFLLINVEQ